MGGGMSAATHRPLPEIEADIADVRAALKAARNASTYSAAGVSVSRSYGELRAELRDLQDERAAALRARRGPVLAITTYRRRAF